MAEYFVSGLQTAFSPLTLIYIAGGMLWGMIGGAMPGISGSVAMALMLPMMLSMEPMLALPMLCAIYVGAEYGGSIPAILIKTPGTGANAATVIDGYELQKKGRGGEALFVSLYSGTIGGVISVVLLAIFAIPLASFGLKFGPSQYFLLGIMGLTIVGSLSGKNQIKGLLSAFFGLFLACIGMDPVTAGSRYTFGYYKLSSGIDLIPLIVGMFAISEVIRQIYAGEIKPRPKEKTIIKLPDLKVIKTITPIAVICGVVGTIVGALPGAGANIASWLCYSQAKNWCKNSETFGSGDIRGVAAPEAGNNAVPAGALIPLLGLGIPGSNSTAVLLAAFGMFSIAPGPLLFSQQPEIPYTIMACMLAAQIVMFIIGMLLIKPAVRVTEINTTVMAAAIVMFAFIGAFSVENSSFDIILAFVFGFIGFFMKQYGFAPAATVLGFVLGELVEGNLRRALTISGGSISIFFEGPINVVLILLVIFGLLFPFVSQKVRERTKNRGKQEEAL